MKILMVTPYLPYPPASGGQIRTLNLLKYLSKKNDIVLVALYKKESDRKYVSFLTPYCNQIYLCKRAENPWQIKNIIRSILSFQPFLIVRNFSVEGAETIERLLENEQFDVIHSETFYVMPHLPPTQIPILLVEQTIEYKVYQHFVDNLPFIVRPFFYPDILKLKYWEKYYWSKASVVATVSQHDREIIKKLTSDTDPVVIPNGAGDDMFVSTLPTKTFKKPDLLFIGNFFWLQNIEAANFLIEKILPLLSRELPQCKIIIAGQEAQRLQAKKLPNLSVVDVPVDENEMVKSFYRTSTLFVAPIFGPGGTRLKILAAMAAGLPVVSTRTGIEGLSVKNMTHVLIADTPEKFVEEIKLALTDKNLYKKLQKNSFTEVKKSFSWDAISNKLEKVYGDMIKANEIRN